MCVSHRTPGKTITMIIPVQVRKWGTIPEEERQNTCHKNLFPQLLYRYIAVPITWILRQLPTYVHKPSSLIMAHRATIVGANRHRSEKEGVHSEPDKVGPDSRWSNWVIWVGDERVSYTTVQTMSNSIRWLEWLLNKFSLILHCIQLKLKMIY